MKHSEQVLYELRELSQVDFGSDLGVNLTVKNARHYGLAFARAAWLLVIEGRFACVTTG